MRTQSMLSRGVWRHAPQKHLDFTSFETASGAVWGQGNRERNCASPLHTGDNCTGIFTCTCVFSLVHETLRQPMQFWVETIVPICSLILMYVHMFAQLSKALPSSLVYLLPICATCSVNASLTWLPSWWNTYAFVSCSQEKVLRFVYSTTLSLLHSSMDESNLLFPGLVITFSNRIILAAQTNVRTKYAAFAFASWLPLTKFHPQRAQGNGKPLKSGSQTVTGRLAHLHS